MVLISLALQFTDQIPILLILCPNGLTKFCTNRISYQFWKTLRWSYVSSGVASASSCKMNHVIRTVPPFKIFYELLRFDVGLRHSFETLTASSISDHAWLQATLPIRVGGLGLREASRASFAAFIGSCNSSHQLLFQLLHNSMPMLFLQHDHPHHIGEENVDLIIPGETQCRQHLTSILPAWHQ